MSIPSPNYVHPFLKVAAAASGKPVFYWYSNSRDGTALCALKEDLVPGNTVGTVGQVSEHAFYILSTLDLVSFGFHDWDNGGIASLIRLFLSNFDSSLPVHIGSHRYSKRAANILERVDHHPGKPLHFLSGSQIQLVSGSAVIGCKESITLTFDPEELPWQEPGGVWLREGFTRFRRRVIGAGENGAIFTRYREDLGVMGKSEEFTPYIKKQRFPETTELEVSGHEGTSRLRSLECSVIVPDSLTTPSNAFRHTLRFYFFPGSGRLARVSVYCSKLNNALHAYVEEDWLRDLQIALLLATRTVVSMHA